MLDIEYTTGSGRGKMSIDIEKLLPCSQKDFRILLNTVELSTNAGDHAETLYNFIAEKAAKIKDIRGRLDDRNPKDKETRRRLNVDLKKWVALAGMLSKMFDTPEISDDESKIKLKSCTIYAMFTGSGGREIKIYTGWSFEKFGFTFEVYKERPGRYEILLSGTGTRCATCTNKDGAPVEITPELAGILKKNIDGGKMQELYKMYKETMTAAGYMEDDTTETTNKTTNEKEKKTMMNEKYFAGVKTLEELRNKYRDLLKANHPDNGGSEEITKEINTQYEKAFDLLKAGANLEDEKTAIKWSEAEDAAIREALYKIIHLENINIEVVGCWIWVDGDTYAGRDTLKAAGYKWSKARKKWHFAPYEKKFYKGSKKSFDQIRREYGSTTVNNEKQERITA